MTSQLNQAQISSYQRENYIGRGMREPTSGVVVRRLPEFIAAAAHAAVKRDHADDEFDIAHYGFLNELKTIRTDNMGMDIIVY